MNVLTAATLSFCMHLQHICISLYVCMHCNDTKICTHESKLSVLFGTNCFHSAFWFVVTPLDCIGLHWRVKSKGYKKSPKKSPQILRLWHMWNIWLLQGMHSTQNMGEALGSHVRHTFNCSFLITKAPALNDCMCFIADGLITVTPARLIRRFFIPPYHRNRTTDFYSRTR